MKTPVSSCSAGGQRPCISCLKPKSNRWTPSIVLLGVLEIALMLTRCFKMLHELFHWDFWLWTPRALKSTVLLQAGKRRIWGGSNCHDQARKSSAGLCWARASLLASVGRDIALWKCFRSVKCCLCHRANAARLNFFPCPLLPVLIFISAKILPWNFSNLCYQHKLLSLLS